MVFSLLILQAIGLMRSTSTHPPLLNSTHLMQYEETEVTLPHFRNIRKSNKVCNPMEIYLDTNENNRYNPNNERNTQHTPRIMQHATRIEVDIRSRGLK